MNFNKMKWQMQKVTKRIFMNFSNLRVSIALKIGGKPLDNYYGNIIYKLQNRCKNLEERLKWQEYRVLEHCWKKYK